VRVGDRVGAHTTLGRVGATGHASGPHLHFEVRVRGAAVDALIVLR
jgi:murein DD-endopeptidase MepM/ murein hydrolase activator NlpD